MFFHCSSPKRQDAIQTLQESSCPNVGLLMNLSHFLLRVICQALLAYSIGDKPPVSFRINLFQLFCYSVFYHLGLDTRPICAWNGLSLKVVYFPLLFVHLVWGMGLMSNRDLSNYVIGGVSPLRAVRGSWGQFHTFEAISCCLFTTAIALPICEAAAGCHIAAIAPVWWETIHFI